jgi:hypothetical protein
MSPEQAGGKRRIVLVAALACAAVGLALGLSVQYAPKHQQIGRDSGVFLYAGWQVLEGKRPYADVWDHKPPMVYLINAAGVAIGDRFGVWLLETLLFAAGTALLFVATSRRCGVFPAVVGVAYVVHASRIGTFHQGGNLTEGYAQYFAMLILAGALWGPRRAVCWVLMGLGGALVFLTKQSSISTPVAVGAVLIWCALVRREADARRRLLAYCAGGFGALALAVILMAATGILRDFWECNFVFNRLYVGERAFPASAEKLSPGLMGLVGGAYDSLRNEGLYYSVILAAVGCVLAMLVPGADRTPARRAATTVLVALLLDIAAAAMPGTFFGHYYLTLLPLIGAGLAFWIEAAGRLAEIALRGRATLLRSLAVNWVLFWLCAFTLTGPTAIFQGSNGAAKAVAPPPAGEDPELTAYLDARPPGPLLMWGAETKWNFLSRRPAPTRYCYNYPLTFSRYDQAGRFAEFLADLKRHPDAIIIDADFRSYVSLDPHVEDPQRGLGTTIPVELMAELRAYVAEHYRRDRTFPKSDGWVAYVPKE